MDRHARGGLGRALLLLAALAATRAACFPEPRAPWPALVEPLPLRLEELRGASFRLLPGVGPVLAGRLEAARRAAGGRLDLAGAARVPGVGPALLAEWSRRLPAGAAAVDAAPLAP